jgi:ATP-dependent DNA ligase
MPWLKMRTEEFFDAVILAVKKTDDWNTEGIPRTFLLGCYDPKQGFIKIGGAGSGLTLHEKASIGEIVELLRINEDS